MVGGAGPGGGSGWFTLVAAGIERVAAGLASDCPAHGGRVKAPARPRKSPG